MLDCGGGTDPAHTTSLTKLVIRRSVGRPIDCLYNVGGDHLARVADAVRAAVGLPPRSWP